MGGLIREERIKSTQTEKKEILSAALYTPELTSSCLCVCVRVFVFVPARVYTSPHPPFHSTTQEKEDEAEEQRSPNRNYY